MTEILKLVSENPMATLGVALYLIFFVMVIAYKTAENKTRKMVMEKMLAKMPKLTLASLEERLGRHSPVEAAAIVIDTFEVAEVTNMQNTVMEELEKESAYKAKIAEHEEKVAEETLKESEERAAMLRKKAEEAEATGKTEAARHKTIAEEAKARHAKLMKIASMAEDF